MRFCPNKVTTGGIQKHAIFSLYDAIIFKQRQTDLYLDCKRFTLLLNTPRHFLSMNSQNSNSLRCFLLTAQGRDYNNRYEIVLWACTEENRPVKIIVDNYQPLFFIPTTLSANSTFGATKRTSLEMSTFDNQKIDCLYFSTSHSMQQSAKELRTKGYNVFESDIRPLERYLMERMVMGAMEITGTPSMVNSAITYRNPKIRGCQFTPVLKVLSIDIETCVSTGEIYSIASQSQQESAVFIRGERIQNTHENITFCLDEKELLVAFFAFVRENDPDIIIGWNVTDFDLNVLAQRSRVHRLPFGMGRESGAVVLENKNAKHIARIPGRAVLDLPLMLRAYHHSFEEYSLNHVASKLLGKVKTIELKGPQKIKEIDHLFATDKIKLALYNLTDAQLTLEIFDKTGLLQIALERSKKSGLLLDRTGGSIASFDYIYLPRLHRAGYVANDLQDIAPPSQPLPGGYVLEPKPGFYREVMVLDFKSLYPSIIMTFLIDPLGFRKTDELSVSNPAQTHFSVQSHLLPEIIHDLMESRAVARKENNPFLSQAIKILMNSFYGVLGSTGCRFFSQEIASTITITGQYILKKSIEYIESIPGLKVIYGDTDSLFVLPDESKLTVTETTGHELAKEVTTWLTDHIKTTFNARSALELQFETLFSHIFMPSIRGTTQGSKKHYCGATTDKQGCIQRLLFKGMESARSDWTDLAKEFQHELFMRVFTKKALDDYIINTVQLLKQGIFDQKLVYKKRLRKRIDEYTVNIPPHAQAARLLDSPSGVIRYYITTDGPQPLEKRTAPIDYSHYVDCQLKPIADTLLEQMNSSFDQIISGQQDLFK